MKNNKTPTFISCPNDEQRYRTAAFENKKIGHNTLNLATKLVSRGMCFPKGASTMYLYGPAGVGKTTLLQNIVSHMDQGDLLYNLVKSPETTIFGWFDFQRRLLMSLDARANQKISYEEMNIRRTSSGSIRIDSKTTTISELRLAVIKAMKYTRVSKYIFDEVPHIKKGRSEHRIADQMDALKSFIDEASLELESCGITPVFVLAGTYELVEMMSLNGQLGRRSIKVPFHRYNLQNPTHARAYQSVITSFQDAMDLPNKPDLVSRLEYLYVYSCGCVGVLKQWLNRAYSDAVISNAKTITNKHLKDHAPHKADVQRLSSEIAAGESKLQELSGSLSTIYMNLGISADHIASMREYVEDAENLSESAEE